MSERPGLGCDAIVRTPEDTFLPDAIRGCLFDLDGVLTDTAVLHQRAWTTAFNQYFAERSETTQGAGERAVAPFTAADYFEMVDGKPRHEAVAAVLSNRGLAVTGAADASQREAIVTTIGEHKQELYLQEVARHGVPTLPGAVAYLTAVRASRRAVGVVSSSRNARHVLAITGLASYIDVRVDGQYLHDHDIPGKPSPQPFLEAARMLGETPHACAVYEDALAGIHSGAEGRFGLVVAIAPAARARAMREAGAHVVTPDLHHLLARGILS